MTPHLQLRGDTRDKYRVNKSQIDLAFILIRKQTNWSTHDGMEEEL